MNETAPPDQTTDVCDALDEAGLYNTLAKSSPPHRRRIYYRRKDRALAQALLQAPEQFVVDSIDYYDPDVVGVSHLQSSRRFHVRISRLEPRLEALMLALVLEAGLERPASTPTRSDPQPERYVP